MGVGDRVTLSALFGSVTLLIGTLVVAGLLVFVGGGDADGYNLDRLSWRVDGLQEYVQFKGMQKL